MSQALQAAQAFMAAVNAQDEGAAQALTSPGAWCLEGHSPQNIFVQAGRKSLHLAEAEGIDAAKHVAVIRVGVYREGVDTPLQSLFFMMENQAAGWLIGGVTKDEAFYTRFMAGVITADFSWSNLLPDADLRQWGQRLVRALREQDFDALNSLHGDFGALIQFVRVKLLEPGGKVELGDCLAYEPLKRYALCLTYAGADGIEEDLYLILAKDAQGTFEIVDHSAYPALELLLKS